MSGISVTNLTQFFLIAEPALCLLALGSIYKRGQLRTFWFLALFLAFRAASVLSGAWLFNASSAFMDIHRAYKIYFYIYWASYAIEAILGFIMIYGLYNLAMKPLPGLQRLGRLMFRWAAGIGLALSVAMAFGPQVSGGTFLIRMISQLQQTQSVLTLCLLFFVCVAVRPMGLSARSKIFGVSLGLGVMATYDLVQSSWLANVHSMNSLLNVIGGAATVFALSIWISYFALPEPKRRMIMLPTTSPFLRWNQISAVLNDSPGFVALGEVTEEMFAPAEVIFMHGATANLTHATALSSPLPPHNGRPPGRPSCFAHPTKLA